MIQLDHLPKVCGNGLFFFQDVINNLKFFSEIYLHFKNTLLLKLHK